MLSSSRFPSDVASSACVDRPAGLGWELVEAAEQADAHALAPQLVGLAADGRLEQAEQAPDFVVGARPVLAAERVQRQDGDAPSDGMAEDLADGLDAGGMPIELRQPLLACPATVAIHDDRDVARQLVGGQERGLHGRIVRRGGRDRHGDGDRGRRVVGGRWRVGRPGQRCAGH